MSHSLKMTFTCTRFLSRLSTPVLKRHARKFTQLHSGTKHASPASEILRRWFCDKPVDLYAAINENDFEEYTETSNYKDVNFESIARGDPNMIYALKNIQLEIDIFAQEGGQVPSSLSATNWSDLLSCRSKTKRMKHLRYLWRNETRKLDRKRRQALNREQLNEFRETKKPDPIFSTNSPVEYGLLRTTLFHRFYDTDMKDLYNFRLLQASMFGPHLIIDCSYDDFMSQFDLSICSKDLLKAWSNNREHFYPFDMIFCNLKQDSKSFAKMNAVFPAIEHDPACPFNFTDKHYLDLFPKEKLVYLTPNSNEEMEYYDGDSIYIIGALWDKSQNAALSFAKAKKEGLRRYKLPLDRYLKWNFGKKTLSINDCVCILNDLKDGGSWDFALRFIKYRQMGRIDLYDDGKDLKTNAKTGAHFEELDRRKSIYDILLKQKAKKT